MSRTSSSGRPYRRAQAQVFAEEYLCWRCGQPVDQTLPANHDMARSADHVIPTSLGGGDHRDNLRLAHRRCNVLGRHTPPGIPIEGRAVPAPARIGRNGRPRHGWYCDDPTNCPTSDDGPHSGSCHKKRADGTPVGMHWEGPPRTSHTVNELTDSYM